jgi:pimeloyl-ACP methyl ester carboxylesterase
METVTSTDGSVIAYDRSGSGEPVVFVSGAFNDRTTCAPVAALLSDRFATVCYDRRGRGDSTDNATVSSIPEEGMGRELEDLAAVIDRVGGPVAVFGFSSGGILALRAAVAGLPITRIALYEPPFPTGPHRAGLARRLAGLIIDGSRGDAVATFQTEGIGLPGELVEQIRNSDGWPYLEAMATSTVYDAALTTLDRPTPEMTALTQPMIVINGAETWPALRTTALDLPNRLPTAHHVEVAGGANHTMPPAATAEAMRAFLTAPAAKA